ncbi:hypothetical protein [Aliikangiella sp. G2MR2-5]|uniref:hypothetical protein n=1 Tax=Aliikangiella sp. G2MR2-5 TaxID=2788943 RepID=UPI0018A91BEB|nr:hypothetical protein [Aliikangiella sp. G2MR2-5]
MKFVSNGNQIECIRRVRDLSDGGMNDVLIVSFDQEQESIPPHVAACLSPFEVKKLKSWLHERVELNRKLENETMEDTILDTLPQMLSIAKEALKDIDVIDIGLFKQLKVELREFDEMLSRFRNISKTDTIELDKMQDSEVLKEKLSTIQEQL